MNTGFGCKDLPNPYHTCAKCNGLPQDEVQTKCHFFCKSCLETHLSESNVCPSCNETITIEQISLVPYTQTSYYNSFVVSCNICNETMTRGAFKHHSARCSGQKTTQIGITSLFIPYADITKGEAIGKGQFGTVHLCQWKNKGDNEPVAVKFMTIPDANTDMQTKQEWIKELNIMSQLRSNTVTHVYGYSEHANEFLIIMEFVDGGSLRNLLDNKIKFANMTFQDKWALMRQAAESVAFLHERGIVHRDIKSLNFLITKDGKTLKIADFGLAKSEVMETMRDTSFVGTERFMAPELFEGDQKYTSACDIYSLGMTFFEIATGDVPFSHYERNARVVMAVLDHERPEIPYDCPDVIINLIRYCWSQLAHERPSAREVLQYMDRYVVVQEQKRHFFEIDKAELLRNVPHSCVHSYDAPPTIPPHILGSHKLPETPEKITVVTLNRDDYSAHAMTTNSYPMTIFARVELQLHRFFDSPNTVNSSVRLESVDIIINDKLEQRFKERENELHNRCKGRSSLADDKQTELQKMYLDGLTGKSILVNNRNSNSLTAWHGAAKSKIHSIMWYGMLNLSTTDDGFYGKAIYLTQKPNYGASYVQQVNKDSNENELLLCWASLGDPFAQTKLDMGRSLEQGYDSHYILVKNKPASKDFFQEEEVFEYMKTSGDLYYPVQDAQEGIDGDEIALFRSDQVLPRYVVRYSTKGEKLGSFKFDKERSDALLRAEVERGDLRSVQVVVRNGANVNQVYEDGVTPLHLAATKDVSVVEFLIQNGADVDAFDDNGYTALRFAVLDEKASTVELLINNGANVNAYDQSGRTPLHYAIKMKLYEIVKLMLQHGGDIFMRDEDNWSALHFAATAGSVEILQLLCLYDIQINARCESNNTPLIMAIKEGHFEAVKFLLEQKAGAEEGGQYGWTPLMWASLAGKVEIAKLLVQYGANVNACDKYNESCIHLAIRNLHTSMVEFLIESGAEPNRIEFGQDSPFISAVNKGDYNTCKLLLQYTNVNDTTISGSTALHEAAQKGHFEIVKLLLQNGANVHAVTTHNLYPISWSIAKGHMAITELLLQAGSVVNLEHYDADMTPLSFAAKSGSIPMILLLLEYGALVNSTNKRNSTALYSAIIAGKEEAVKVLLERGADVNIVDIDHKNAILIAANNNQAKMIEILVHHGSNIDCVDNDGRTPLILATRAGHLSAVKALIVLKANPYLKDQNNMTAFQYAIQLKKTDISTFLSDINRSWKDKFLAQETKPKKILLGKQEFLTYVESSNYSSETELFTGEEFFDTLLVKYLEFEFSEDEKRDIVSLLIKLIIKWNELEKVPEQVQGGDWFQAAVDRGKIKAVQEKKLFARLSAVVLTKVLAELSYYEAFIYVTRRSFGELRALNQRIASFKHCGDEEMRIAGIELHAAMNRKKIEPVAQKRVLVWVSDQEHELMEQASRQGIDIIRFVAVGPALIYLDQHKELFELGPNSFRVVATKKMSIKIRTKTIANERAGMDLLEKLRMKQQQVPILVIGEGTTLHQRAYVTEQEQMIQDFVLMQDLINLS